MVKQPHGLQTSKGYDSQPAAADEGCFTVQFDLTEQASEFQLQKQAVLVAYQWQGFCMQAALTLIGYKEA